MLTPVPKGCRIGLMNRDIVFGFMRYASSEARPMGFDFIKALKEYWPLFLSSMKTAWSFHELLRYLEANFTFLWLAR